MLTRLLVLLALAAVAFVPAAHPASLASPAGLHGFLLRADEPVVNTFPRTPSFAWTPYDNAQSYDFELATSKSFEDTDMVWSSASRSAPLPVPVVSIPVTLPWMTGSPYALYARVRARTASGVSKWSTPFGFNMRWKAPPEKVAPDIPGLVRWQPVEGATSYEVWFVDAAKVITTTTNVADEREYYSFHQDPAWTGTVQWRVRAIRTLYGSLPSGVPAVSAGPWSETFVSTNPPVSSGGLSPSMTVSDAVSTDTAPAAHSLTPGFAFSGDTATNGISGRLYRVYVSTDRQCVNIVFKGAVVGSPAYAPRTSGPIVLPTSQAAVTAAETSYPADGTQTGAFTADLQAVTTSEQSGSTPTASTATTPSTTDTTTTTTTTTTTPTATAAAPATTTGTAPSGFSASGSLVDLWDSGWPTGRYYWTVVPVREVVSGTTVQYYDAELPQDACAAGRVVTFGKASSPATLSAGKPYASGLSRYGNLVAAQAKVPSFYRAALIAWQPAPGAAGYEVQWSKTRSPWTPASKTPFYTAASSVLLEGLAPGVWYYRVRGIDPYVPVAAKQMTWSAPVGIKLNKPTFVIQSGVTTRPVKK